MITKHPRLSFRPGFHKRFMAGTPWAYSNEIIMDGAAKALPPGSVMTLTDAGGALLATVQFNPRTLIAARVIAKPDVTIDGAFYEGRIRAALALRERLYARPFYRLIHAEADGLPGLIVDRYGDVCVIQPNTAGMDAALADIVAALNSVVSPRAIVMRGDNAARGLEGLPEEDVKLLAGNLDGPVPVEENGVTYFADLMGGQKTGWFFDQRDNRAFMASLSKDRSVLDLYSHTGAFGLAAAVAGAKDVTAVDSSQLALDLAIKGAEANNVKARCTFTKAEVFAFLEKAGEKKWDVVIADPPAFVKSRKDLKPGLQGYRKLARLSAQVTAKGGVMLVASCSHNAPLPEFAEAVARGIHDAGRTARIIRTAGAAADHPVHPHLPESAYLKAQVFLLD